MRVSHSDFLHQKIRRQPNGSFRRSSMGHRGIRSLYSPCGDIAECVLGRIALNRDGLSIGVVVPETASILAPFIAWLLVASVAGLVVLPLWRVRPLGWPPQRRRALAWGGAHVAAAFFVFWFLPGLLYPFVDPEALGRLFVGESGNPQTGKVLSLAAAGTLALPLQLLAWRGLLATVEPHPMPSITRHNTVRGVRMGYLIWLIVTPAVYFVGFFALLVNAWLGGHSEQHPLMKAFEPGAASAGVLLLLLAEAVIAAPIREELLFRGILLPWLAERSWGGDAALVFAAAIGVLLRPTPDAQGLT